MSVKNILIVSTCFIDWGGSEELWAQSVPHLLNSGHKITVYKKHLNYHHPKFAELAAKGVTLTDTRSTYNLGRRIISRGLITLNNAYTEIKKLAPIKQADRAFIANLKEHTPDLVIISQGINFDGLEHAYQCLLLNIPYVIICQKAVDFYWPGVGDRPFMIKTLVNAKQIFFVSQHNYKLTEEQFGVRLPNGRVIFNPVKVSRYPLPFPDTSKGYKLACVARLFLLDKGQDILIRILGQEKWKNRPFSVSFVGSGDDLEPLRAMAKLLAIQNVEFIGQVDNIESIWHNYHALILPSRSEGLPLSVVEAMASGRPVIITNAGGTAEIVEDGATGFVGKIDHDMFDDAMERAWNGRNNWENIGKKAAEYIAETVPKEPELEFAKIINELIND